MNLYIYEQTTSTNDLGKSPSFVEGDLIWAHSQSAGRGQRGNKWVTDEQNLTFSIILEPTGLAAADQFLIAQVTALALVKTLVSYGIEARIKWTNDIYIGDKKVAGVLIENSLSNGVVSRSIIGIGLNVNQLEFDSSLPNPTSMSLHTNQRYDREQVLRRVHSYLFEIINSADIAKEYNSLLYRLDERHTYRLADGTLINATLIGVAPRGELQLRHDSGEVVGYLFKEITFVI